MFPLSHVITPLSSSALLKCHRFVISQTLLYLKYWHQTSSSLLLKMSPASSCPLIFYASDFKGPFGLSSVHNTIHYKHLSTSYLKGSIFSNVRHLTALYMFSPLLSRRNKSPGSRTSRSSFSPSARQKQRPVTHSGDQAPPICLF